MDSDHLLGLLALTATLLFFAWAWTRRSVARDTEDPYRSPESEAADWREIRDEQERLERK